MLRVKDLIKLFEDADPEAVLAVESSTWKMITTKVEVEYSQSNYYHPDNVDGEYPDDEQPTFLVIKEA